MDVVAEDLGIQPLQYGNIDKYIWINDSFQGHSRAQRLFDYMLKRNIYIKGFVTNVKSMFSLKMYNKEIYNIDKVDKEYSAIFKESAEGAMVVETCDGERYAGSVGKQESTFCLSLENNEISKAITYDDGVKKERLFCLDSFWMFNHFAGKKIYIYGIGLIEAEFAKYLKLLDYDFNGFLADGDDVDQAAAEGYAVRYVEDILYEDGWYIWANDKKKAEKLNDLGFRYFVDYYIKDYRFDVTINKKDILDINLGHSYIADSRYSGFVIHGDKKETGLKIAVLGGSTTDGTMYPFKSWPQLLYEELGEEKVTIYNGGVCSYTSGQELIKLLRDVLQLKPDIIIVYDGYNDLAFSVDAQYPFTSIYLEEIFEYANEHIEVDDCLDKNSIHVCRGIPSQQDYFENWMSNIKIMHAIANERNIDFFCFCQPVLSSKKKLTVKEENILLSILSSKIKLFKEESFRDHMAQMTDKPNYLYDLSHIFDTETDVYMDVCHVWENGNRIIAREIGKAILPTLLKKDNWDKKIKRK